MKKLSNPSEIARETLKHLAARRLQPTPDHYEEIYHEVAGVSPERTEGGIHPLAAEILKLLRAFPRQSPELQRQITQIDKAAQVREWHTISHLLVGAIESQSGQAELVRGWADLIRDLVTQWDLRSPHFSTARKSESLTKVLLNFGNHPSLLNQKLDALIKGWADRKANSESIQMVDDDPPPDTEAAASAADTTATTANALVMDWQVWRDILVKALRFGLAERLTDLPELAEDALSLALAAESVSSKEGVDFLNRRLKSFWVQLELKTERNQRINASLVNLLLLLSENIAMVSGTDRNLLGQVALVRDILSQPLTMRRLYDAETAFKEIVYQQSNMRQSLGEAQAALKSMITLFVNRLGAMADSTGDYHDRIENYAERIQKTNEITDLNALLTELMQDTRHMQLDMVRSKEEMIGARDKAEAAERRIAELEEELRSVSEKVREDQLTGALNRRGFEEMFNTEIARMERSSKSLCVGLLDIDNFKKLNDRLGHQAGDEALIHLVAVVKETLRPTDVVARYGGEEFVVLLPESSLSEATLVMRRVQRELTKRFFLHNNERVLITFSAGVTLYIPGERRDDAIDRADHAMYHAKKSGKNQVVVAEELLKMN